MTVARFWTITDTEVKISPPRNPGGNGDGLGNGGNNNGGGGRDNNNGGRGNGGGPTKGTVGGGKNGNGGVIAELNPVIWVDGHQEVYSDLGKTTLSTEGGNVVTWGNLGSWGTDATQVSGATQQTTYDEDHINADDDVVVFSGNTSRMTFGNVTDFNGAPGLHGFMVFGVTNPAISQYPIGMAGAGGLNFGIYASGPPNIVLRITTDVGTTNVSGGGTVTLPNEDSTTQMGLIYFSWDSSDGAIRFGSYEDSALRTGTQTGTGLASVTSDLTIGGWDGQTRDVDGRIAEVVVFNEYLGTTDEAAVLAELADRWGFITTP